MRCIGPINDERQRLTALLKKASEEPAGLLKNFDNMFIGMALIKNNWLLQYILETRGCTVIDGPFRGMLYDPPVYEGGMLARLLGTYEHELHPHILGAAQRRYDAVLNVGCAEGYYAVGLAKLMPDATVHAYEIVPSRLDSCRTVAADNGVAGRMVFGGECTGEIIAGFRNRRTLIVCDIEGGEFDLLDPARIPALAGMDIIAEIHPDGDRTAEAFASRFRETHQCRIVPPTVGSGMHVPALTGMGDLNKLLAACEFRGTETPWAVLTSKSLHAAGDH